MNLPPLPFFITFYRFVMTTTTTTFLLFSIHRTATATAIATATAAHHHQLYIISIFPLQPPPPPLIAVQFVVARLNFLIDPTTKGTLQGKNAEAESILNTYHFCTYMETFVIFQVTPMYENKNLPKIENEVMGTAPG